MADGRWTMTEQELDRVAGGFDLPDTGSLPNHGLRRAVDDRNGQALNACAFCGSDDLTTGLGGYGAGYGYRTVRCRRCGGLTDFVYKDDTHRFF